MEQKTIETDVHIGRKIADVLKEKNMLHAQLGRLLGIKAPSVSYMIDRETMDVKQLVRVSRLLKHNFLKYFDMTSVEEVAGNKGQGAKDASTTLSTGKDEKDIRIEGLMQKIAGLEKEIERLKVDGVMKENEWLRKINGLLEKK